MVGQGVDERFVLRIGVDVRVGGVVLAGGITGYVTDLVSVIFGIADAVFVVGVLPDLSGCGLANGVG